MRLSHPVASLRVHRSILLYGRQTTCRVDAKRRTARQMSGPGSNLAAEDLPLQPSRPSRRLRRLCETCGGGRSCGALRVRPWLLAGASLLVLLVLPSTMEPAHDLGRFECILAELHAMVCGMCSGSLALLNAGVRGARLLLAVARPRGAGILKPPKGSCARLP